MDAGATAGWAPSTGASMVYRMSCTPHGTGKKGAKLTYYTGNVLVEKS